MFSVILLSRFMQSPSKTHYGAAKRVLRYIWGTTNFGIINHHVDNLKLVAYSDSDWAGCMEDGKSTSGFALSLASWLIYLTTNKQHSVALSSYETEYVAATKASRHVVCLRRILVDLKEKQDKPTIMYCDNKSNIAMTRNPVFHGRTKHIELRHQFISWKRRSWALGPEKFDNFRSSVGCSRGLNQGRICWRIIQSPTVDCYSIALGSCYAVVY